MTRWLGVLLSGENSRFRGPQACTCAHQARRVSGHKCNIINSAPEGSSIPTQSLLPAGIKILSCVTSNKLLNFSVPHFPICTSVAKAWCCLGTMLCSSSHGCCGDGPLFNFYRFWRVWGKSRLSFKLPNLFLVFSPACTSALTLLDVFYGFSRGLCPSPMWSFSNTSQASTLPLYGCHFVFCTYLIDHLAYTALCAHPTPTSLVSQGRDACCSLGWKNKASLSWLLGC